MLGDNMLKGAASFDTPPSRRRLTVSSEFPANIDQQFARPSSQRVASSPRRMPNPSHPPQSHPPQSSSQPTPARVMSEEAAALSKLKGTNSQMADLLGKCIDVLEIELFEKREKMEHKEEDANVDQYSPDEASLVSVLAGIKHVRDVLSGKQPSFDPSVIPVNTPTTPTTTTTTTAPSQPTPTTPITGTAAPTTPTTASAAGVTTDTASTDDQPSLKDWDVVDYQEDDKQSILSSQDPGTKPLPQLQPTKSQEAHPEPSTLTNKATSESAPSSSSARRTAAPKENVVYSIEDLLSDPTLQKEKASSTRSSKFNWMLDEQENDKGDRPAHLFRPTSSPRKRASVNFSNYAKSPTSPSSGSAVQTVDPLGAKSTD